MKRCKNTSSLMKAVVLGFLIIFMGIIILSAWETKSTYFGLPKQCVTIVDFSKHPSREDPYLLTQANERVKWEGSYVALVKKLSQGFPFNLDVVRDGGELTYIDVSQKKELMLLAMAIFIFVIPFIIYPSGKITWEAFIAFSGRGIKSKSEVSVPTSNESRRKYYRLTLWVQTGVCLIFLMVWTFFWGIDKLLLVFIGLLLLTYILFYKQQYIPDALMVVLFVGGFSLGCRSIAMLNDCKTELVEASICYVKRTSSPRISDGVPYTVNHNHFFVSYNWNGVQKYDTFTISDRAVIGADLLQYVSSDKMPLSISVHNGKVVIAKRDIVAGVIFTSIGSLICLLLAGRLFWGAVSKRMGKADGVERQ